MLTFFLIHDKKYLKHKEKIVTYQIYENTIAIIMVDTMVSTVTIAVVNDRQTRLII